jgi:antitoxin PrlF
MPAVQSKLTSKGQVTIPREIRAKLQLATGDRVEWVARADGVVELRKVQSLVLEDVVGMLGRPPRPASIEEMDAAIRERFRRAGD